MEIELDKQTSDSPNRDLLNNHKSSRQLKYPEQLATKGSGYVTNNVTCLSH